MQIKEVERITGITSKNIRFYEKQGLLSPTRDAKNLYRGFSDDDVKRLKEIKLLRKFGVGLADIKSIQEGDMSLTECMQMYLRYFNKQKKELDKVIELCENIEKKDADLQAIDVDYYLDTIDSVEKSNPGFVNIARDFLTKAKSVIPLQPKTFFEPTAPIIDSHDFMVELEKYAEREGKSIMFISLGMRPTIRLDGHRYICALEMPRYLHFPFSIFFVTRFNFGYRFVYLYEDFTQEW